MKISREAYEQIKNTVGTYKAESGGILLGSREDNIIQKFVFDEKGVTGSVNYDPDVTFLNKIIKEEWENNSLELIGFAHSHPHGISRLSGDWGGNIGDIAYIKAMFNAIPDLEKFLVPIVYSSYGGAEFKIFPYVAERNNEENYYMKELEVIEELVLQKDTEDTVTSKNKTKKSRGKTAFTNTKAAKLKLEGAVDRKLMENSKIVVIGCGGAMRLCEDLIRTGIGELVVVDFDKLDKTNIFTQGAYPDEIGRLKVRVLKDRVLRINPDVKITAINRDFLKMGQKEIDDICSGASQILMMTDSHLAQAKGNQVALEKKIPALFAMMFEKAQCFEAFFYIPCVTPACFRCAVSPRYEAYHNGYQNEISSNGSTIFQTNYLNSVLGMLSLAMLHNDIDNVEFGNWFGNSWDRNYLQTKIHPEYYGSTSENSIFKKVERGIGKKAFNFHTAWQTIEREVPPTYEMPCPDCAKDIK
ncbi:ThiF family adenylyltransferase [uncultured Draconibacterium sp.]|uniref:ThiF family adenylyltransferase n=1 Tax=uncultured Draconibacterium sp. TaxID=1573823 RepID=UPI0029C658D2|nr:ThiF family adenylyltransferase [uncultured Draconibacterium sp.]